MSKKTLLNETTVRRFMKLANMEPLTSPFVDRLSERAPYGGNKGDDSRSDRDYMEEDAEYGGDKGDESRSHRDYMGEDAHEEEELHATEDELGAEDHEADEEREEIGDLEADDAAAPLEEMLEGVEVVDDSDLINEVAKRVTARLAKAMAAKK